MTETAEDDLTRVEQIRRQRALKAANAALSAVVMVLLLFASFAIGHALGPTPMRRLELVAGIGLSFLIGVGLSFPLVRRRLEYGATFRLDVTEGRHRRRVLVFEDHLVLDQEVIMFEQVNGADRDGNKLVLTYDDPIHDGRMLRELEGTGDGIASLASRIGRRPRPSAGGLPRRSTERRPRRSTDRST